MADMKSCDACGTVYPDYAMHSNDRKLVGVSGIQVEMYPDYCPECLRKKFVQILERIEKGAGDAVVQNEGD